MMPGLQGVGAQPAPERNAADLRHQTTGEDLAMEFGDGEARQWHIGASGQLARQPLNVVDDA